MVLRPGGKELVGFGRKPADTDQAAFQGIHALNPLIVIDEACGVPKSIFDAVDALATNDNARVLAIGNPDDPASHFAEICKPGSGWHVITISAFDTPAFTGEEVPRAAAAARCPRVGRGAQEALGRNSPIYQSKVLGEFPDISDDSLIHPKWIEAAQKRQLPRDNKPELGVDIARYGEDETVIMRREGGWVRLYRAHSSSTRWRRPATSPRPSRTSTPSSTVRGLGRAPSTRLESAAACLTGCSS